MGNGDVLGYDGIALGGRDNPPQRIPPTGGGREFKQPQLLPVVLVDKNSK